MKKIFLFLFVLGSCMDKIERIAVVKNESKKSIILMWGMDSVTDKILYYDRKYEIPKDSCQVLISMTKFNIVTFYIFDKDSVSKYLSLKEINGIVKRSFLKKIMITHDSLRVNDTVIFKESPRNR